MSTVVPFKTRPRVSNYFGGCPTCGGTDGYLNAGRNHWFTCVEHGVRWCAGSNLFSDWRNETEEQQERNIATLLPLREVQPLRPTDEEAVDERS